MCRGVGPIRTPDGESFEAFIRKALIDELQVAEVYAPSAPVVLAGNVEQFDFSSHSGKWAIALTLTSSNGRRITVSDEYDYGGFYFIGEVACRQAGPALMPAVQNIVGKAARHPDFPGAHQMIVVPDYRGHRIEINAIAVKTADRWNAEVRISLARSPRYRDADVPEAERRSRGTGRRDLRVLPPANRVALVFGPMGAAEETA